METLYERIGGRKTIEKLITAFYRRVLADPLLSPFFVDTTIEKLERMQVAFFSIALGGPEPDEMPALAQAHRDRGIEIKHLTRYTELLIDTLGEIGVEKNDARNVYERIATYSNEVLGDTSVDG